MAILLSLVICILATSQLAKIFNSKVVKNFGSDRPLLLGQHGQLFAFTWNLGGWGGGGGCEK